MAHKDRTKIYLPHPPKKPTGKCPLCNTKGPQSHRQQHLLTGCAALNQHYEQWAVAVNACFHQSVAALVSTLPLRLKIQQEAQLCISQAQKSHSPSAWKHHCPFISLSGTITEGFLKLITPLTYQQQQHLTWTLQERIAAAANHTLSVFNKKNGTFQGASISQL